ncbi:MAG: hypothetical protein MI924_36165 [Chloroflexales bacterium]|nr:hypothetical protein [Chloroflexales bacterium]
MVGDLATLLELRRPARRRTSKPISTLAFDSLYAFLALLVVIGIFIDVWSHTAFGPDQSVLSAYHFLFYTSMAMIGGLLLYVHTMNVRAGYRWDSALPIGYGLSFAGVILFGIFGVLDLTGHALFGFETGMEAILSPSHNLGFLSLFVVALGPARAVFARHSRGQTLPMREMPLVVIAAVTLISPLTFAMLGFTPLSDMPRAVQEMRGSAEGSAKALELGGIFVQTLVIMSMLLWFVSRVRLPKGAMTLLFAVYGLLLSVISVYPLAFVVTALAGISVEIVYHLTQPALDNPLRFRLFGLFAPMAIWATYYAFYGFTGIGGGIWFTNYIWSGAIVQSGLFGFVLAFFATMNLTSNSSEAYALGAREL